VGDHSGPLVARLFQILLAIIFAIAWISLLRQVRVLIGSRGLLPWEEFVAAAHHRGTPPFWQLPSLFWIGDGDRVLLAGCFVGVGLAAATALGWRARLCLALNTLLYLSYATACRTFLSFQWDNLLLECGLLATFLPTDRPSRLIHLLFRILLFKLYWESGVAKWQSHIGDWQNGSAMTFYYETAPLPTPLALWAHALPAAWHHLESWLTLFLELVVPLAAFGPRPARRFAFVTLSGFQILNIATANYGFFSYLAVALHVFLLDDDDVRWLFRRRSASSENQPLLAFRPLRRGLAISGAVAYLFFSAVDGALAFAPLGSWGPALYDVHQWYGPWRLINTYHLFGQITRERIEPEFQTFDGKDWHAHDLVYKPGSPQRRPPFVAPHQPRVDFQLWFYGLSFQRGAPEYVATLLARLCRDPQAVQSLFAAPLPPHPEAVRIVYWQYHFSTPQELERSGDWWQRRELASTRPLRCSE
jgi:lipase maturation factor 1